jgi:hypothetical protein
VRAPSYKLLEDPWRSLIDQVAGHLHSDQPVEAVKLAMEATGVKGNPEAAGFRTQCLQGLLTWCLSRRHYMDAAVLCWPKNMFFSNPVPYYTRTVWDALDRGDGILFQGGASTSKTYGCGVYYFLDWLADPLYTTVRVAGPSEDHLTDNLFSHLVNLHQNSAIKLPGMIGDLFIGLSLRNRRSAIRGVVFPLGRRPSGRLQGAKRFPRPSAHPEFGPLSRLRVLLDEVEHMPPGVWSDLDNLLSNTDEEKKEGLKIASAYNPKDPAGPCGVRAEPDKGHAEVDPDKDERWISKRGWLVVRLDGEKCENVVQGKDVFPGLQTRAGLDRLAQASGGRHSAGYATFGRAMFPKQGSLFTVITPAMVAAARGTFIWAAPPRRLGGCDLALEGGDTPAFAIGELGLATGIKRPPSLMHPAGNVEMFKDKHGRGIRRWGLCCTAMLALEAGDTVKMFEELRTTAFRAGIAPEWLAVDRTGHTAGVHDLCKNNWSPNVIGVNFSESASDLKILEEDQDIARVMYDRACSELHFALAKWMQAGAFLIAPDVDMSEITPQLTGRMYDPKIKNKVESKREFKYRNQGNSPDEAEALTLLVHPARMTGRIVPSIMQTGPADSQNGFDSEDGEHFYYRIGATDRVDAGL